MSARESRNGWHDPTKFLKRSSQWLAVCVLEEGWAFVIFACHPRIADVTVREQLKMCDLR